LRTVLHIYYQWGSFSESEMVVHWLWDLDILVRWAGSLVERSYAIQGSPFELQQREDSR
jgi:hypothetical protein